jgi:hypothetical protein
MEKVWITTAEVQLQPEDTPSGNVLGFMKIIMWSSSEEELIKKINLYLDQYDWKLLAIEKTQLADMSVDYSDEINQLVDEVFQDKNAIRLGTFYSYKPD